MITENTRTENRWTGIVRMRIPQAAVQSRGEKSIQVTESTRPEMIGYASTGYGGVNSGSSNHSGGQERQDYGVDPFSTGPNHRSDRPYGMTGTYEWNFADYDQQSNIPDRDQAARKKRGRMAAIPSSLQ